MTATIPSIRSAVVLDGPRGSGSNQQKNFYLLTDLVSIKPMEGEGVYLSPHQKLNLLLRSEKVRKDSGGQILGIIDPLSAQFESGQFRTSDEEVIKMLDKHPARTLKFFKHEDVVKMKTDTDVAQVNRMIAAAEASPEVMDILRKRLGETDFVLPSKANGAPPQDFSEDVLPSKTRKK